MANLRDDLTEKTLGTCTMEKLLGRGGMGSVYLARQTRPARNVAVKVLQPNLTVNSVMHQEFLTRFRREADVIARLEHINIMPIYEYGEQDGLAYLVMPYLSGGSLRDVLSKRGALTQEETATYLDQAAAALEYAHTHGVIHRDLKPANFLLAGDGRLVLADFGIARIIQSSTIDGATLTNTGTILGTPEYMAPEMARGEHVDYRADIYEMGIVLFQMLSGRVPFAGTTPYAVVLKHVQEPLPSLHQINAAFSQAIDIVIQKATAKLPADRYQSAKEMAEAFRRAITGTMVMPSPNTPGTSPAVVSTSASAQSAPVPVSPAPAQYGTMNTIPATPGPYNTVAPPPPGTMHNQYQSYPGYTPGQQAPSIQPGAPTTPKRQRGPLILVLLTLAVVLIGGTVLATQLVKGGSQGQLSGTPTATAQGSTATPSSTMTATPAPTITSTPILTPTTTPGGIPKGNQFYQTNRPGPNCDSSNGTWVIYNKATLNCQGGATILKNTAQSPGLEGIFLTKINGQDYSSDYVIEAEMQQDPQSNSDFGIYFRNQPGSTQQGVYTFLVHPDGTWSATAYDNTTGAPIGSKTGTLGDAHKAVTLDIVANGTQFSFYANGKLLDTQTDDTYTRGTVGFAVQQGASVSISKFALYYPAGA